MVGGAGAVAGPILAEPANAQAITIVLSGWVMSEDASTLPLAAASARW